MTTRLPPAPVTRGAIGLVLLMFVLQQFGGGQETLIRHLALWPGLDPGDPRRAAGWPEFAPWQLLSYALLHGGGLHLFLNLFGLWMFGRPVEWAIGSRRMAFYLLLCIVGAGLSQLVAMSLEGEHRPTIGISGGVMALLPAFAILFPKARITLLIPPIPLPAPVFVLLYALIELSLGWSGARTGIAHFAHLGGMACGLVVLGAWYFGGELRPRPLQPPLDRESPPDRGRPPD